MTVKEDDVLKLTCEASNSLPAANISWYLDNKTHSVHADDRLLNASKTEDIRNVDRTISVKSTLTHTVSREENGMVVYCNANHTGTPSIKFVTENITITTSSISVMRNDEIRIACIADGNPPPTYTWSTGHKEPIITKAFDSDSNLTCEVSNTLYPTGDDNPPYILALWVNTTCIQNYSLKQKCLQVIEHDRVRVECVAAGNPEPTCQWTSHSQSCTLEISKVSKEHAGTYVCHTYNTMNTSYGNPPNITNLNRYVEVIEGVNFNLTCEAEPGNSNVTSYYWTSTNLPGMNTSDQYLIIQNISRTNEGVFTCFAQNIMQRTGCTEITGNKASIMTFTAMNTTRTTVQHGDEVNFYCEVDSDPPALISILSANGSIIKHIHGKNQLNYTKKSSCLIDIGPFTCLSANKHNSKQPDRRNITAHLYIGRITFQNTPLKLDQEVSVFSNPPPTYFTWTNVSNNMQIPIVSTASDRVIINSTDKMSTALIITSVASWDSGNYSVRVENEIGYKIETFYIIVDVQSTIANTPQNDKRNGSKYIIAIVGSVCGIAVVVLLLRLWWLKRSTPIHDNNTLQLLRDTRHDSGRMETIVDNVLPINDETPEYEEEKHIYANIQIKDAFGGKSLTIKTLRAGVGRTGTFIALDYLYDQGKVDEKLNFPETVNVLREQRVSLVQTKEQYLYLHEAISELLDPIGLIFTSKNSMRFQSTVTDDRKLNKEFEAITDAVVNVKTVENEKDFNRMPDGQLPENKCKSIDMNVIPDDMFRPLISSGNDFINAVYIPTYREGQKYIVTQFPLQNTTVDFVRLLWDHNIRDVEQYQFCHEVVFEYLKNREEKVEDSENQEYVNMTFPKFL
ncbi:PTPRG-like protein [Mya arenaria]|uniref:PTPRG-like protein n=1 Tax=Mya arenaria TaxID=6604 RepID=A0ABY7EAM7_MYAAR|nr:PTPRG-like protein [Mya arenaria]